METEELVPIAKAAEELEASKSSLARAMNKLRIKPVKRGLVSREQMRAIKDVLDRRRNTGGRECKLGLKERKIYIPHPRIRKPTSIRDTPVRHRKTARYRISVWEQHEGEEGHYYTKRLGLTRDQAKEAIKLYESYGLRAIAVKY